MLKLVKRIFEDNNERELRRLTKLMERIDSMESQIQKLDDDQIKKKTIELRNRLANGIQPQEILTEAFALVREAAKRVLSMRHFSVQLMGGAALYEGHIVEMLTGEGKTLVGTLPVYLHALTGKGVHVVTVNDYLASRDSQLMGQIYRALGLTVGCTLSGMSREQKRDAYACDITYGTCSEFGFDFLHDHMAIFDNQIVQRPPYFAMIDEVDSILIDEARTPLIISGKAQRTTDYYFKANLFASTLNEGRDFSIDTKFRTVVLTESCVKMAEEYFQINNLFDLEHTIVNHHINQALRAHYLLKRDVDYLVKEDEIIIVDEFTGRLMTGRRYSDGLHQAIEAKEGLQIQSENKTQAAITIQNYFKVYPKIAGMTGTARTEVDEFGRVYGLNVICIPTNRPNIRVDLSDVVYKTEEGKYRAVAAEVVRRYTLGQPVLVGTVSIEKSEYLSSKLAELNIPHRVLNANHHESEAEIIRDAGKLGSVTISTNMAGRGTDIKLGEGVAELGGLHVIGTERHDSRRIDNQLRGRAGRQGDPGSTQFFLSMEDSLMKRFGSAAMLAKLEKVGFDEISPLEGTMVSRSIESAQNIVEGANFESLLNVMQYDDVVNRQRERIYRDRREVISSNSMHNVVMSMVRAVAERVIDKYCPNDEVPENWDLVNLAAYLDRVIVSDSQIEAEQLWGKEKEEIADVVINLAEQAYIAKERIIGQDALKQFEIFMILRIVDNKWIEHINAMDHLRQGIHLRVYSGSDPLQEYEVEGHEMFLHTISRIEEEIVQQILKVKIVNPPHNSELV